MSLPDRIDAALDGRLMSAHDLAMRLWPPDENPKAWRNKMGGGPPGCYMALGSALRRGGFRVTIEGPGPGHRFVSPRRRK